MPRPASIFPALALIATIGAAFAAPTVETPVPLAVSGHGLRQWSAAELLARPDARAIDLPIDPTYRRPMTYRAVPLPALLHDAGIAPGDTVQFVATDGFVAELPARLLLATGGASPWLAVEDPATPWPALPGHGANGTTSTPPGESAPGTTKAPSAGPFYLVWQHPEKSHIHPEQWPYGIVALRRVIPLAERFPALLPDPSLPANSPMRRGLMAFTIHCLPCHTLNGQGDAQVGPDLNRPHNPSEYLSEPYLRLLIRNPQQLRDWPGAKMPGVGREHLSDAELDDLLAYLRHMAGRKTP